jgi:hypothetical protein
MKIEIPTIDDLDEILVVSRIWYDSMDFDRFGKHFDIETIKALWKDSLISPFQYDVLVAREKNAIIGAFGIVYKTTHTWFKGILQGYELVFHADPRLPRFVQGKVMMKLLNEMLPKMQSRNADAIYVGFDPRFPEVGDMLRRKGAVDVSGTVMFRFKGDKPCLT